MIIMGTGNDLNLKISSTSHRDIHDKSSSNRPTLPILCDVVPAFGYRIPWRGSDNQETLQWARGGTSRV